jgi:hypothetical protein
VPGNAGTRKHLLKQCGRRSRPCLVDTRPLQCGAPVAPIWHDAMLTIVGLPTPLRSERGGTRMLAPLRGVVRPRRKVRFARLIQRPVRVLGGPAVGAASGGNLSLPCLPPTVVRCGAVLLPTSAAAGTGGAPSFSKLTVVPSLESRPTKSRGSTGPVWSTALD